MTNNNTKYLLSPDALYHASGLAQFDVSSTADLDAVPTSIGQDRALKAIEFSLDMDQQGFNLYVMGSTGLGRHTLVREILEARAENLPLPADYCYVANPQDPDTPVFMRLPAGTARQLRADLQLPFTEQLLDDLATKYREYPDVLTYITGLKSNVAEKVEKTGVASRPGHINILVDNTDTPAAPVVFEHNPTYQNLIGRIEHLTQMGTLVTDFSLVKAGSLLKANGGFLVLDAEKIFARLDAWEGLKRALTAGEVRIQPPECQANLACTASLELQAIPIKVKVVLVGNRQLFYLLKEYDPEFNLLFKVAADLAEEMPRDKSTELLYARLVATLQRRENLREIERDGIARVIENSARQTQVGGKLSLHIGHLLDLLHEADYHAKRDDSLTIRRQDVQAAIKAQRYRASQLQEQLQEETLDGTLRIDTEGTQLAQINSLTVMEIGDYAFGIPTRISATARMGHGEVIDIERETEQGGPIHSKGILILSSYLGMRYAKHQPLTLSASLVFEQTYSQVEGDSASAAELCALISAIADIPIKQSLAITGSINQHGQMQAVGGVCEKIEGFFDLCNQRGLNNEQGVIIPGANVPHLMLKQELVDAVASGKFHVYAVDHVEHALELLTGLSSGRPNKDGEFPKDSINYLVLLRLAEWIALRLHYAGQSPTNPE